MARLLLGCMGQHAHIVEQAPDACAHITHQEIASMVGSVREVVQRALKELERMGRLRLSALASVSATSPSSNGGHTSSA